MPLKLFKRNGIWNYRGKVAGRRLRKSTGTADKVIAARIASKVENKLWNSHLDGPQETLTFPQAVELYQNAGKGMDAKSKRYIAKLEDHWKNKKVKEMTAGAIRQSAIDLYPGRSGATMNRQVVTMTRAIINHCADLERCSHVRVKRFDFEQEIKKPVSLEWVATFSLHARPVIKAMVLGMFATACRFAEVHRIEWEDIDFQAMTIKVRDTKTKKQRFAHMPNPLLVALANLPRDKKPFFKSESTLRRHWDQDVAKAAKAVNGFERLTFHCCRHGFATKMLRDGIDPKTAAELGGWDDIALFMKTYAHAMKDATLTDGLFDTPVTRGNKRIEQKQIVKGRE